MKNFIIRTLSGLAFTVLVIGSILYGPVAFAVVFGLIMTLAVYEFLNITLGRGFSGENLPAKAFTIVAAISLFANVFLISAYGLDPLYLLFTMLPIVGIFISNMYVKEYNVHGTQMVDGVQQRRPNGYEMFPFSIAALVYVALPFSLFSLVLFDKTGVYNGNLLLSMMVLLWCTDVGAYLLGSTLGQMPRNLSQLITSFIASESQGIRHVPFPTFFLINTHFDVISVRVIYTFSLY